jgi:glycosyltransferase involved in cell wall biosynthesis
MAFGRCVVAHDTAENIETMGGAGRAYDGARGADALAPVLQALVDAPALVAELGSAARARAQAAYTWAAVTEAYEALFYRLCGLELPPATGDP